MSIQQQAFLQLSDSIKSEQIDNFLSGRPWQRQYVTAMNFQQESALQKIYDQRHTHHHQKMSRHGLIQADRPDHCHLAGESAVFGK